MGRATLNVQSRFKGELFQSTPSVGRATVIACLKSLVEKISIHALRGEGDERLRGRACVNLSNFNPRPPWGGRRRLPASDLRQGKISIHALRGEGDSDIQTTRRQSHISIHALRGEGDYRPDEKDRGQRRISIHALRGEGDAPKSTAHEDDKEFQSTPSVGRATSNSQRYKALGNISIHALRGEGDDSSIQARTAEKIFQSTPSVGRATLKTLRQCATEGKFQSTPSVGRATCDSCHSLYTSSFQSTPSVGRATKYRSRISSVSDISIHALRGEGDFLASGIKQSRLIISIHALRGEGDDR